MEEKPAELPVSPQVRQPADQIQPPSFLDKLKIHKGKILGGILGILVFVGAVFGAYKLGQRQIQPPQPTPTPVAATTPTPDLTVDWKTYTNDELSFKYPSHWTIETNRIIGTDPNVVIYVVSKDSTLMNECMRMDTTEKKDGLVIKKFSRVTTGEMCSTDDPSPREIWVVPTEDDYSPGINYSYTVKDNPGAEDIFNLILSTFKFLEEEGTSPTPTPITQNYPRPSSWKTITISSLKISLCLPPKWEWETDASGYGHIVFNRDPAYKPNVAWINFFDYKGGSRREEYINLKVQYEYEPDKLRNETKVDEFSINGQSVLKIAIPSFPEAIVFVLDNKLYEVSLASWNLVNDSQSAFLKDIYTMVGCIQPI